MPHLFKKCILCNHETETKMQKAQKFYLSQYESEDIHLSAYNFTLPQELIATFPTYPKENAKLLVYQNGNVIHTTFAYLFNFIPKNYLIVLNNTKVLKARFFARKIQYTNNFTTSYNDKEQEFLYHKPLSNNRHLVQIRGKTQLFDSFILTTKIHYIIIQILHIHKNGFKEVCFFNLSDIPSPHRILQYNPLNNQEVLNILEQYGMIPLPPYIKRKTMQQDEIDYQSIFATAQGSIAAPTASLHFSKSMFSYLQYHYHHVFVTLHIGAGTFQPVSTQNILEHTMHTESCWIPKESAQCINETQHILCIGTTAMRSVEWFVQTQQTSGENNIFLNPYNPPKKVTALLTNFHLPKSSLIMLVSSMIGRQETLRIYNEAIQKQYKFYSYGDGMLILL